MLKNQSFPQQLLGSWQLCTFHSPPAKPAKYKIDRRRFVSLFVYKNYWMWLNWFEGSNESLLFLFHGQIPGKSNGSLWSPFKYLIYILDSCESPQGGLMQPLLLPHIHTLGTESNLEFRFSLYGHLSCWLVSPGREGGGWTILSMSK